MFSFKAFNNLLVCLILALSWCSVSRGDAAPSEYPPCPTWMYRQSPLDKECTCGNDLHDAVTCLPEKYSAIVIKDFCIALDEDHNSTVIIGTCPYSTGGKLPKHIPDVKDFQLVIYAIRFIEEISSVEHVRRTTLSQSIPITWDVSSVRIMSMGGSSSLLLLLFL